MKSLHASLAGGAAIGVALAVSLAQAGSVDLPFAFEAGTPAVADEVNANFDALEVAVDDNDSRIGSLESAVPNTGRVVFTGAALSSTHPQQAFGTLFPQFGGAAITIPRPLDYPQGADVTIRLAWRTLLVNDAGIVDFFVRPRSLNPGDGWFDSAGIGSPVIVPANSQFSYFETEIVMPATQFEESIWIISIQRGGSSSTYSADVELAYASLEYDLG